MILRKLGDNLELNLQLWDGSDSQPKRVFVDLKKIDGVLTKPRFEILHKGDGLYAENVESMPADSVILASFIVFESDGATRSTIHAVGQEIYVRDITGEIVSANLDVAVSSVDRAKADLSGTIEVAVTTGTIEKQEILGTIEENNIITGVVE